MVQLVEPLLIFNEKTGHVDRVLFVRTKTRGIIKAVQRSIDVVEKPTAEYFRPSDRDLACVKRLIGA